MNIKTFCKEGGNMSPIEKIEQIEKSLQHKSCTKSMTPKFKGMISMILVVALLISGSLAYFTDYATTSVTGTAGTVDISLESGINLLNEDGMDILNPGDLRDATITIRNDGNKSVDTRTTIELTVQSNTVHDLEFSGDTNTQSEYDLYLREDVELIEGEGWKPKDGAEPLKVKSVDGNTITYVLPDTSLNGNHDKHDEVETIDGVDEYSHTYDLVLIFKGESGNEWQDSNVNIKTTVEAKQHENTSDWDIVIVENTNNLPRHTLMSGLGNVQGTVDTEVVVFTNKPVPAEAKDGFVVDASANKDGSIMVWWEPTYTHNGTEYDMKTMYISAVDGGVIEANENSSAMFNYAGTTGWAIKYVDFSNFDISTAKNVSNMFLDCDDLIAIKASNWTDQATVTNDANMFSGCTSLVGAVPYDAGNVGFEMANLNGYFVGEFASIEADEACSHNYVEIGTDAADCYSDGYTYYTCELCGASSSVKVEDKLGHNYEETVIAPQVGAQGYTKYECSRCGNTYKDNFVDAIDEESVEHDHVEIASENGKHVFCANVKSVHMSEDGTTTYYPYELYTEPGDTENPNPDTTCTSHSWGEGCVCVICGEAYHIEVGGVCQICGHKNPDYVAAPADSCRTDDGLHNHKEVVVGDVIYVYCDHIESPVRSEDNSVIFYPYSFYFE